MNEKDLIRLEQVSQFLDGTQAVAFTVLSDKKRIATSGLLVP